MISSSTFGRVAPARHHRPFLGLVSAILLGLAGVSCLGGWYDQRGGPAIADAIEAADSEIVSSVTYNFGDGLDPATIIIRLVEGATDQAIGEFVCAVVAPALAAGDPPDHFGVILLDHRDRWIMFAEDHICP